VFFYPLLPVLALLAEVHIRPFFLRPNAKPFRMPGIKFPGLTRPIEASSKNRKNGLGLLPGRLVKQIDSNRNKQ
jgi:hypothetical protein